MQADLRPLIAARLDPAAPGADVRARAVLATAFACFDAASMAWVEDNGESEIMDLYDQCLAAVRN